MKNTIKIIGIFALAAMLGLVVAACKKTSNENSSTENDNSGTVMSSSSDSNQALFAITSLPMGTYSVSIYRTEYEYKNSSKIEALRNDFNAKRAALEEADNYNYSPAYKAALFKLIKSHPYNYLATGFASGEGSKSIELKDYDSNTWTGTGNFQVFLALDSGTSGEVDMTGMRLRTQSWWATVNFSEGKATVDFSIFKAGTLY
jgi:hypothetical protein